MKKSNTEKVIDWRRRSTLTFILCAPLTFLYYIFKFRLAGYGFSALVCLVLIALILFYAFMPAVGLKFPRFSFWTVHIVTVCLVVGLVVCAVTEGFILRASRGSAEEEIADCDYLIVLGAKVRPDGPSVSLWDRIYAASDFLNAHPNMVAVVSGGQGPDEVKTEAECMAENLIALGITAERIRLENRAESTAQNIRYSLDLIESETGSRPGKIAVLSSEYHLFRASLYTKAEGAEFVGVPAKTSRIAQLVNHCMREVAGVWHWILLEQ